MADLSPQLPDASLQWKQGYFDICHYLPPRSLAFAMHRCTPHLQQQCKGGQPSLLRPPSLLRRRKGRYNVNALPEPLRDGALASMLPTMDGATAMLEVLLKVWAFLPPLSLRPAWCFRLHQALQLCSPQPWGAACKLCQ